MPRFANEWYLQLELNFYKNQHTTTQNNTHYKALVASPKLITKQFKFNCSTKETNYSFFGFQNSTHLQNT